VSGPRETAEKETAEAPSLCHLLRNGIGAAIAYKLGLEEARVIIADNGASLAF